MLKKKAEKTGSDLAKKVKKRFKSNEPFFISSRLGINIIEENNGVFGDLRIFASYNHKNRAITLFNNLLPKNYLVAHELYHYYEQNEKIKQSNELSEISAHHFAKKITTDLTE